MNTHMLIKYNDMHRNEKQQIHSHGYFWGGRETKETWTSKEILWLKKENLKQKYPNIFYFWFLDRSSSLGWQRVAEMFPFTTSLVDEELNISWEFHVDAQRTHSAWGCNHRCAALCSRMGLNFDWSELVWALGAVLGVPGSEGHWQTGVYSDKSKQATVTECVKQFAW